MSHKLLFGFVFVAAPTIGYSYVLHKDKVRAGRVRICSKHPISESQVLISMRSFLRHGKRRASRTNSRTKGLGLITYDQLLSGTGNKNKRPPRTRPFSAPGAIAAAASPLFRQPRRTIHSDKARLIGKVRVSSFP